MSGMKVHQEVINISTRGCCMTNITAQLRAVVEASGVTTGMCVAFIQHTSASLVIQENADPSVQADLLAWLGDLAPEKRPWAHADEGADDMPAHAKSAVTRTSETIPVTGGRLALGTWQGLFLVEHRARPHQRRVVVHVQGV